VESRHFLEASQAAVEGARVASVRLLAASIALLVLPGLLVACGGDDAGSSGSADVALLKGQPLLLVSGVDVPEDAADVQPSATFEDENVSGWTGCNSYTGGFEMNGSSLVISQIASTRMACPSPADGIEQEYLAALARVAGWSIEDDEVVLVDADESELLRYERATPVGRWQVTGLLTGDALASPIAGTKLTATFGDDATISGSSGCNTYTAAYTTDKGAIEIADVAGTKMACPQPAGVMEQETSYLTLLSRAASFRVDGPVLELLDVDRQRLVAFARAP
jgi:heat shock protein HslJ